MAVRVAPSTEPLGDAPAPTAGSQLPPSRPARLRAFGRTTPARMVSLGIGLIALALLSGTVAAVQVADRQRTLDTLLTRIEPLADASQHLYSSLSIADATATTAFLSGGLEPAAVRDRYAQAVGDAGQDLVDASAGVAADDTAARDLLTELSAGLPVYTGLVETARANNRSGYPVGSAYLSEASSMMQSTLLPLAERLHTEQSDRVVQSQDEFARPPWLAIALLVLALAALVIASILLARWTRRRLNFGLIVAAVAVAASVCWLVVAGLVSATATGHALDQGARPLTDLTTARILAQQARADEMLGLVRRELSAKYEQQFDDHLARLQAIFDDYPRSGRVEVGTAQVAAAAEASAAWSRAHRQLDSLLGSGDWTGAVTMAVGTGDRDSASHFAETDSELSDAIGQTRTELRRNVDRAVSTLTALAPGALVLAALAVAGIVSGLLPRLREYQ
ncbi:hypothetical protein FK531_11445 [Rhodococcus spelaei]|uniref:Secreted protein n=1 Tax=Rhodococcus spelaei TaxID=2546320 RepID=A0A541BAH4_9NOCA|nr:hypothetical protein [Rhodococcus spelaei]TQF69342.1 hypothetical protein FK531_11445 [Rhodococcus spelaei]